MLSRIFTGARSVILFGVILVLIAILGGCASHLPRQKERSLPDRITPTLLPPVLTDTPASPATATPTPGISFTATATPSSTETPQPTATVPAAENPCPIAGPRDMTALADAHPAAQAEQCALSMPPLENYQWGALGGYTLTYPQEWPAQVSEDGSGGMTFVDPQTNQITLTRTQTDLPLSKIEQSSREYEFITLPLINKIWEQTVSRQAVTLNRRSVVVLDTKIGENFSRRYFLRSEKKPGGRYDLFVFQVMKYGQRIAEFPDLVKEIEDLFKSFQFLPPDTPPLARPAAPDLPVAPVSLPVGVLVDHPTEGEGWLKVISPQGQQLGALSPNIRPTHEPFHLINPYTGDVNQLALAGQDEIPSQRQEVYVSQGGTITKTIPAPWVAWLGAAPGQPVIAYTTINMGTTYNDSRLYLGRAADFPMDPVIKIDWSSGNPYPYAVYARDGHPQGVWFTYQPYGIGGIAYALDIELRYYDAASQITRLVLPGVGISGLSPDYSHAALNTWTAKGLTILNLVDHKEINFPMAPDSDRSGAYARFSPDNRYVAWMESSGYPAGLDTGAPPLRSRLRVAAIDSQVEPPAGKIIYDFLDADFSHTAGYSADWVQPVGWLDNNNLLVQISKLYVGKTVLLRLNVQDASISLFSEGTFVDFAYAPSTSASVPTPGPTASVPAQADPTPVPPAGKILFEKKRVSGLALDDRYVYWLEPGRIVRQRLVSTLKPQPETVVKTVYTNGRIGLLDSQRKGDWLFYVDCDSPGIPGNWTLFALNVQTGEKKIIEQSQNTGQIYAYAVDGDRVAVSLLDHATSKKCQDDSVLTVITISTLQHQELDRACFDSDYNWSGVALSGDQLFASRFHENTRTFELVRYDLKSGSGQPLDPALSATVSWVDGGSLAASSSWLAWSYLQNSGYIDNLQTGESRQVPTPADAGILKFPQISGRWLYWRVNDRPVVYDIQQNTLRYLSKLEGNQSLEEMVMFGNRAAWVVNLQADQAVSDSIIEWADLPPETNSPASP